MNNNPSIWRILAFISLLGLLCAPHSANAQWQQVFGPTGGDVEAITSDASGHIYAGTDTGVYVSSTNGNTWTLKRNGLLNPEIFSFAVTQTGAVLAGTEGSGIFRTTNFGDSWDSASTGLPYSSNILSLASDGHGDLYAGHSTKGVFYSSDDGLHWITRNTGMETQNVFALTITPSGTIYAGTTPYIFSSTDQGQHWDTAFIPPGPVTGSAVDEVLALAADSSGDVFAGTWHGHRYRLLSGSNTWDDLSPVALSSILEVKALATSGNAIFAGLFGAAVIESNDLGSSWSPNSNGLTDPQIYSLTVAPAGYLFAGTYLAEVFRSNLSMAVGEDGDSSKSFEAWPQPFVGSITLQCTLTEDRTVNIAIYNSVGNRVKQLPEQHFGAGESTVMLNLADLPGGVYFAVFKMSTGIRTIRLDCLN